MKDIFVHPTGEPKNGALVPVSGPVAVDTFGGRVHVEWDPEAAVTPLGQLPFFTEYLRVSGLFDPWVEDCPLEWTSPNARPPDLGDFEQTPAARNSRRVRRLHGG
jgi:hypothetical protein